MSAEDLEKYETDMELQLYREYRDVVGLFSHVVETERRFYLCNSVDVKVRGDAGGELEFSAYECGVSELGWILEASLMACELWESVRRQDRLTLLSPSAPQALAFSPEAAELTLADGRRVSASLLVGADGRDSWVRREAGLVARNAPYGEMGVVANFTCARPHRGIARQWFRADGVLACCRSPMPTASTGFRSSGRRPTRTPQNCSPCRRKNCARGSPRPAAACSATSSRSRRRRPSPCA